MTQVNFGTHAILFEFQRMKFRYYRNVNYCLLYVKNSNYYIIYYIYLPSMHKVVSVLYVDDRPICL